MQNTCSITPCFDVFFLTFSVFFAQFFQCFNETIKLAGYCMHCVMSSAPSRFTQLLDGDFNMLEKLSQMMSWLWEEIVNFLYCPNKVTTTGIVSAASTSSKFSEWLSHFSVLVIAGQHTDAWYWYSKSVCLSVHLSVTFRYQMKTT